MKTINIHHLGYKVSHGIADTGQHYMSCIRIDDNHCKIIYKSKPRPNDIPTLAHEVLHALQYMSESRGIDMTIEMEHMGYLMQYILNEILGLKYGK